MQTIRLCVGVVQVKARDSETSVIGFHIETADSRMTELNAQAIIYIIGSDP